MKVRISDFNANAGRAAGSVVTCGLARNRSNLPRVELLWDRWSPQILIPLIALVIRLVALTVSFHGNASVVSWEDVAIAENLLEGKGYTIDNTWRSRMLYSFVEIRDPDNRG